jgi:hypothetical protein
VEKVQGDVKDLCNALATKTVDLIKKRPFSSVNCHEAGGPFVKATVMKGGVVHLEVRADKKPREIETSQLHSLPVSFHQHAPSLSLHLSKVLSR